MRKITYSFEQWCIDTERTDLLNRWDYSKNILKPSEVSYKSEKQIWFLCPEGRHESELHKIDNLANGRNKTIYCERCRSFAQHVIDLYGEEFLNEIWDSQNEKSPWDYTYSSKKYFNYKCNENENHRYKRQICSFFNGGCLFCYEEKLKNETALGNKYPEVLRLWSEKNTKSAYDYSSCQYSYIWLKCNNGIHDDYKTTISSAKRNNFMCKNCIKPVQNSNSMNIINMVGMVCGELKVVSYYGSIDNSAYWECLCSCGKNVIVRGNFLRNGHIVSCGDKAYHYIGENNPNWKGGITSDNIIARMSKEYEEWRNAVFARDGYKCIICESKINIQAHHILSFSSFPMYRFFVPNGATLCANHHQINIAGSFHNIYGTNENNTGENFLDYVNNERKKYGNTLPFDIEDDLKQNILIDYVLNLSDKNSNFNKKESKFIKIKPRFRIKEE